MNCIRSKQHHLLAFLTIALASCSGDSNSPPPPSDVTLDTATAPAASMVKLDGLDLNACPLRSSEIRVAGQTAPAVLNAKHEALMRLPLFYDEATKWSAPPSGPQDVDVFCNGALWGTLPAAITITALPPAPGTTQALLQDYQQVVSDYKALTEQLAPAPGIQQQLFTSIFEGLEGMVAGSDPGSLPVMLDDLEQADPDLLALMDAMYAVGDVDEAVAAFKAQVQNTSAKVAAFTPASLPRPTPTTAPAISLKGAVYVIETPVVLTDAELAAAMGVYDGLKGFSEEFIGKTAEEFGTFEGVLSIFIKSKLASSIASTLSVLDYVLNKLVVSAMPSSLDVISLQLEKDHLENSEFTESDIRLHASNVPEMLKVTEVSSTIVTTLGLSSSGGASGGAVSWLNSFEEVLGNSGKLFTDLVDKAFKKYATENPESFLYDTETFAIVPQMRFEAQGTTRELYDLHPEESNVIHALPEHLEWRASETYWGSANLHITPRVGAFGIESTASNSVRVLVGDLALVLDRYELVIPEGESVDFGVKLSHGPAEGIFVTVSAQRFIGDPDIAIVSSLPITFDDSDWDSYKYISLAAEEDDDEEDGAAPISIWTLIDSGGVEPRQVETSLAATERDNDRLRFVLDPHSVTVPEGEIAQAGVKLSKEPPSRITAIIKHASGDTDISVQSPTLMRFDENNWDTPQTVTVAASPDEDAEEGSAQFRISANEPDVLDAAYLTATEDEDGASLTIEWEQWNPDQIATMQGSIQVELDPSNFSFPLRTNGTLAAQFTSTYTGPFTGIGYVIVSNHPLNEPVCPCTPDLCYEREGSEQTILSIDGHILWDCPPEINCAAYHFGMTLPFLADSEVELTCTESGAGVSYAATLNR